MFKLLSRKLLGERCRSLIKSIMIAAIIGGSLSTMEVNLSITQSVLIMFAIFYSGPIVLQALSSKDNARCLKGLFVMPCNERRTLWEYAAVIGIYTLFTKTILLFGLICGFTKLTTIDIIIMVVASFYSIIGTMIVYGLRKKLPIVSALIIVAAAVLAFFLPKGIMAIAGFAAADVVLLIIFSFLKLEYFRVTESNSVKAVARRSSGSSMLVPRYIIRYILSNKSYIISPLLIIAFAVYFTFTARQSGFPAVVGISLGLISTNSPLSVIVSSNRNLKSKLDVLPGKTKNFFVPYAFVIFCIYLLFYAIFLAAYFMIIKSVDYKALILSPIIAAESAILIAILESRFPITTWKTEPDLLHHPRKYIVPGIIMLEATLVYFLPF